MTNPETPIQKTIRLLKAMPEWDGVTFNGELSEVLRGMVKKPAEHGRGAGDTLPTWMLVLIGEYGFASANSTDVEKLHRWELLMDGIKKYAQEAAIAALTQPKGDGCCVCGWGDGPHARQDCTAELPPPWAMYVGTHEDEYGNVTAMVDVFGESNCQKQNLYTEAQMRAALSLPRQSEAAKPVAIGFRYRMKGHSEGYEVGEWAYVYHRSPDSFELRECEIETVWSGATPPAAQGEVEPAFYVRPGLVETCRQIRHVQKQHRIIVATDPTELHTIPVYFATPAAHGVGKPAGIPSYGGVPIAFDDPELQQW